MKALRSTYHAIALATLALTFATTLLAAGSFTRDDRRAALRLHLSGHSAGLDALNLVVSGVAALRADGTWETLRSDTVTLDLASLQGGVRAMLAEARLPAGAYSAIRVDFAGGSTLVVDGVEHPLGVQGGAGTLSVATPFELRGSERLDLALEIDGANSIAAHEDGTWRLEPCGRMRPAFAPSPILAAL